MSIPVEGEELAKLIEFLRKAQETCATLSHLAAANDRKATSRGWLAVSEQLRVMQHIVTKIATGKMH